MEGNRNGRSLAGLSEFGRKGKHRQSNAIAEIVRLTHGLDDSDTLGDTDYDR